MGSRGAGQGSGRLPHLPPSPTPTQGVWGKSFLFNWIPGWFYPKLLVLLNLNLKILMVKGLLLPQSEYRSLGARESGRSCKQGQGALPSRRVNGYYRVGGRGGGIDRSRSSDLEPRFSCWCSTYLGTRSLLACPDIFPLCAERS